MFGKTIDAIDKNGSGLVQIYEGENPPLIPTDRVIQAECRYARIESGKWVLMDDGDHIISAEV